MKYSFFCILLANLYILGAVISFRPVVSIMCLGMACLWLLSSVYGNYLEKLEAIQFRYYMENLFKNGTDKRRQRASSNKS